MSMRQTQEWLDKKLASGAVRVAKPMGPLPVAPEQPCKPRKYRNEPTVEDGIKFDSKREAKRWRELCALQRAGEIVWLARQVRFILAGGIVYVSNFAYVVDIPGNLIIEDVKSEATRKIAAYRMKKRLMRERGFEIVEI